MLASYHVLLCEFTDHPILFFLAKQARMLQQQFSEVNVSIEVPSTKDMPVCIVSLSPPHIILAHSSSNLVEIRSTGTYVVEL